MKKNRKSILYIILSLVMVISGFFFSRILATNFLLPLGHADYIYYESLQDAYEDSDGIIIGKIEKVNRKQLIENVLVGYNKDRIYTYKDTTFQTKALLQELQSVKKDLRDRSITYDVYTVRIIEVIKGDYKENDKIEVKLLSYDDIAQTEGKMNMDEKFYFFLKDYSMIDSSIPASLINPLQGKVKIEDGCVVDGDKLFGIKGEAIKVEDFTEFLKE